MKHDALRTWIVRASRACFVLLILALPWSIAAMSITAVACAVLTLALWLFRPVPRWPATPVGWPALAWLLALATSAAFALDPSASWGRLGKALFPWLVPLAAFHTPDRDRGRAALKALLISSAVAAVVGTGFFLAAGGSYPARARGPSGHYMTFGGQLLLLVAIATAVSLLSRERRWRWSAGLTAAAGIVALALTFTRSAWLGLAAALVVILGGVRPRWIPAFAALLVAVYLLAPGTYRERLHSAFDPTHPANRERTYMWEAGARMFRDHPITGVGLQDLKPIYARYRSPAAQERAGHLHSVPVQIAATMGTIGIAAFLWLYGSLFVAAAVGLGRDLAAGGVEAGLRLGVLGGLVGFLVAGLFEWNFGDEELLYLLYTVVGLAWSARGAASTWAPAPCAPPPPVRPAP